MAKQKILYVEDREQWLSIIERILKNAGYEPVLFNAMMQAKAHYARHQNEIALVLCDGSIDASDDGRNWAKELQAAGKKTVVLSTDPAKGVPFVTKSPLNKDELLSTIARVLNA